MANFYEEIAKEAELDDVTAKRMCLFLRRRFPGEEQTHCLTGYAKEWARRFKTGQEFANADLASYNVLKEIATPRIVDMPKKVQEVKVEPVAPVKEESIVTKIVEKGKAKRKK